MLNETWWMLPYVLNTRLPLITFRMLAYIMKYLSKCASVGTAVAHLKGKFQQPVITDDRAMLYRVNALTATNES